MSGRRPPAHRRDRGRRERLARLLRLRLDDLPHLSGCGRALAPLRCRRSSSSSSSWSDQVRSRSCPAPASSSSSSWSDQAQSCSSPAPASPSSSASSSCDQARSRSCPASASPSSSSSCDRAPMRSAPHQSLGAHRLDAGRLGGDRLRPHDRGLDPHKRRRRGPDDGGRRRLRGSLRRRRLAHDLHALVAGAARHRNSGDADRDLRGDRASPDSARPYPQPPRLRSSAGRRQRTRSARP